MFKYRDLNLYLLNVTFRFGSWFQLVEMILILILLLQIVLIGANSISMINFICFYKVYQVINTNY